MLSLMTSVKCVVITVGHRHGIPLNIASSRACASIHIAGSPNVGSFVDSPVIIISHPGGPSRGACWAGGRLFCLNFLNPHNVIISRQLHIILYPHDKHDETHFYGHLPPKSFNLICQPLPVLAFIYQSSRPYPSSNRRSRLENLRDWFL